MTSAARLSLAVLVLSLPSTMLAAAPNFVVIMADDLGYGDTSTYGGWIDTPHLDRLAASGLKFTDFHASGNVCSPTRAGLLTGRYQQRAGVPSVINADPEVDAHHHGLHPSEITFNEPLAEAGYATGLFGKWHLGYTRNFNPVHHGFDEFRGYVSGNVDFISHHDRMGVFDWYNGLELDDEPGYTTHLITEHAVRFIEDNRDGPFCVYIAHEAVHSPYQGPNDPPQRGPDAVRGKVDIKEAYRQMMVEMDKGVGQVVETLERLDLAENTLVLFFSDNGACKNGSNGPLRGFKGSDWEGGHREPAVAWWPGRIKPGVVTDQMAITLDIMPTLLDLADAKLPQGHKLDGISLAPLLLKGELLGDRQFFWNGHAMRDGPWKLMIEKGIVGLYNLDDDLGEQNNLAEQYPDRVRSMLAAIEAWKTDVEDGATPQKGRPDTGIH